MRWLAVTIRIYATIKWLTNGSGLAAENEGLATLWVWSFDPAMLRDILPGASGYELVAMINVGYPAAESEPSAMHAERKPVGSW